FLPGRELTVGVVGNGEAAQVIAVMEILFVGGEDRETYTALNKGDWETRMSYALLDGEPLGVRSREVALGAYRALGCRDLARIDLARRAGGRAAVPGGDPAAGPQPHQRRPADPLPPGRPHPRPASPPHRRGRAGAMGDLSRCRVLVAHNPVV